MQVRHLSFITLRQVHHLSFTNPFAFEPEIAVCRVFAEGEVQAVEPLVPILLKGQQFYSHTHTHTYIIIMLYALNLYNAQSWSHVQLFATPSTVACQAPLSLGFSRQEYWSGLPCPPLEDLPDPGIKRILLHLLHCSQILYPLSHLGSPNLYNVACQLYLNKTGKKRFQKRHGA